MLLLNREMLDSSPVKRTLLVGNPSVEVGNLLIINGCTSI